MNHPVPQKKVRADALVLLRGLAETKTKAQALILAGLVRSGDRPIEKAGQLLPENTPLSLKESARFVSRGGLKLEGALEDFGFDAVGVRAADLGASTGGFTDCLLQRGAREVVAVDVGHGQLAEKLRQDPRVTSLERTNARYLTPDQIGGSVDLCVVDASFIGLGKLLPAITAILRSGGALIALIKPQFEVGREEASRHHGIITDQEVRTRAIEQVLEEVKQCGLVIQKDATCRLPGPKGNVEHFVYALKPEVP